MKDEIYIGNLVSPDELRHSAKGSKWKDHKYIKKIGERYYYTKEQLGKAAKKVGSTMASLAASPRERIEQYRTLESTANQAAKDYDEYGTLASKYADEAEQLFSEAKKQEKEQKNNDSYINSQGPREYELLEKNYGTGKTTKTGIKIRNRDRETAKKSVYTSAHTKLYDETGQHFYDTGNLGTRTAGAATKSAQAKRKAQGKLAMSRNYLTKRNEAKTTLDSIQNRDKDIIDKGLDLFYGKRKKKKK